MSTSDLNIRQPATGHDTSLRDALEPGEDRPLSRIVVDKAKGGDAVSVRLVVRHLYPRPRGRPIALALPEGMREGNVVAVFDAMLRAMAAGEITPASPSPVDPSSDAPESRVGGLHLHSACIQRRRSAAERTR